MPFLCPITRKWKEVESWKYKQKTKKVTRDKWIPLRIKDDNVPLKFVVPIETITLKDHNSYKSGLENINYNNYETYGNKGDS
jgi:hypothetical protein